MGNNLFAYCSNNPVTRFDNTGHGWHLAIGATVGALFATAAKILSNVKFGESWYKGVLAANIGGSVSGFLGAAGHWVIGGYAGAATEVLLNQVFSYIPILNDSPKELTGDNLLDSGGEIITDTLVNGTISAACGAVAQELISIPSSWFKPQKLLSCLFGEYAIKEHTQTAIQTTLETSISSGIEAYEKNRQQRPTKTIYPNTVIRAGR